MPEGGVETSSGGGESGAKGGSIFELRMRCAWWMRAGAIPAAGAPVQGASGPSALSGSVGVLQSCIHRGLPGTVRHCGVKTRPRAGPGNAVRPAGLVSATGRCRHSADRVRTRPRWGCVLPTRRWPPKSGGIEPAAAHRPSHSLLPRDSDNTGWKQRRYAAWKAPKRVLRWKARWAWPRRRATPIGAPQPGGLWCHFAATNRVAVATRHSRRKTLP